ncbi:MAG: hypothetical protein PHP98_08155 [Kiritimatiellae bacterium]|nr:hypothetical protein [Kiritimatiellia bacterium]
MKITRGRGAMLAALITAALAGCAHVPPKIDPAGPVEYTVTVQADRTWQNSGIKVKHGQIIQCAAEGQWNDHFASYGPEGNPAVYKKHFGVNAPANALIMRICGQTNLTYFIGKETNIIAERSGQLHFRKNYSLPIGMKGEIQIKVKVCADADGDGICDYDEIHVYKTNPLSPDSDGDGFSDLEETAEMRKKAEENR